MIKMQKLKSREEWLEARKRYIGGSDAACILGLNPWRSNVELWEIKTGRKQAEDISDKPFVKYGHDSEPYLRALFALDFPEYDVWYEENNLWTNDKYPFGHASVDGLLTEKATGRRGVLEIKTTTIMRAGQMEEWHGKIPETYFAQIIWYMGILELDFAICKAQLKRPIDDEIMLTTKHYKIERSEVEDDIAFLMKKGREFAETLKDDNPPALILPEI